jgi:hypothetical protein
VANCPADNDGCKQEYLVVWMGKENAGDMNAGKVSQLIQNATINPQGLADLAVPQFAPNWDGFAVLDAREENADGSRNSYYGKVVNFAQLPLAGSKGGAVECEPHHMQYEWLNGQRIIAGCLFTDFTHILDVKDIPNMTLVNSIFPLENPFGSVPDAYDAFQLDPNGDGNHEDDIFSGTYMGGPDYNFAGSPGSLVQIDGATGQQLSEVRAGTEGQIFTDEREAKVCSFREARPVGTCANPHGIQARPDLGIAITADYAEPRELTLDPIKQVDKYAFRPTVGVWDISDPVNPELIGRAHMPQTPKDPAQRAHDNIGIMEDGKTHGPGNIAEDQQLESKGMFSEAMCGGGVFFAADITNLAENSGQEGSNQWKQVWDDGLSQLASSGSTGTGEGPLNGDWQDEPGGCAGGAWIQVDHNNKRVFRTVQGRVPLADNYFDQGSAKMVYTLDIQDLVVDGQDGSIDSCDLNSDIDGNGLKDYFDLAEQMSDLATTVDSGQDLNQVKQTSAGIGSCPKLLDVLLVRDPTSGGPHWAALDNHTASADGGATRLFFTNYFVARLGVDGDHRAYMVDISPEGNLTYDRKWRDEATGAVGTGFNRRNWPGSPDAGFYKPHSTVWVCPPDVCTDDQS